MVYGRLLGNRSPRTTSGPGALTAAALEPTASIAAEIAVGIFGNALERLVAPEEERPLAELNHESLDALRVLSSV